MTSIVNNIAKIVELRYGGPAKLYSASDRGAGMPRAPIEEEESQQAVSTA